MSENLSKYANFSTMKHQSLAGLTDIIGDNGLENVLLQIAAGSGWNPVYQVNDTETIGDWTESNSGVLDVTAGTNYRVGSHTINITATGACDGVTQYIETKLISGSAQPAAQFGQHYEDWRDSNYLGFWLYGNTGEFDAAGSLKVAIVDLEAGVQTIHDVPAATDSVHQRVEIDISNDTRSKVSAIRFYADTSSISTGDAVEVDSIIRYRLGNGKGPAAGPVILLPVVSGQTVTKGDILSVEVNNATGGIAIQEESGANQVNDIGIACGTGTGVASGKVVVPVQIGGLAYLRANAVTVAGEGLIWQSNSATQGHLVEGVATGLEEYSFARCFEAAGAQYDDILCSIVQPNVFIS